MGWRAPRGLPAGRLPTIRIAAETPPLPATAVLSGLVGVATSVWQVDVLRAGAWAAPGPARALAKRTAGRHRRRIRLRPRLRLRADDGQPGRGRRTAAGARAALAGRHPHRDPPRAAGGGGDPLCDPPHPKANGPGTPLVALPITAGPARTPRAPDGRRRTVRVGQRRGDPAHPSR